ncbi:MAG: hypothetical protein EAZ97_13555 [Bacteroidetes bacterium]|nr:MAG: hypothetical protein EAZ97_13555 [Bacteroidota bacterium]
MTIVDLSEQVFQFLMEKRKEMPDLFFTLRGRADAKLEQGHWFDSRVNYLYFSFWYGWDSVTLAARISIQIGVDGDMQVFLNARDDANFAKIFSVIGKTIAGFTQFKKAGTSENQWLKKYDGADWKLNLNDFIKNAMPLVNNFVEVSNIELPMLNKARFDTGYRRVYKARQSFFHEKEQREAEEKMRQEEELRQLEEKRKVKKLTLKKITLNNIGHFDSINLELNPRVTVLIGENGSGKSTVLRSIALAITGVDVFRADSDDNKYHLKNTELTNWLKILTIDPKTGDANYAEKAFISLEGILDQQPFLNKIRWEKEAKNTYAEVENETNFATIVEKIVEKGKESHTEFHLANLVIGLPQGGGNKRSSEIKSEVYPDPFDLLSIIREEMTEKLANPKKWIELYDFKYKEKEPRDQKYLEAIKHLFKIISKIVSESGSEKEVEFLRFSRSSDNKPLIIVKPDSESESEIFLDLLSEGYKNLFYWIGGILSGLYSFKDWTQTQPQYEGYRNLDIKAIPAVVLIDEIDTYLHPKWQRSILSVLAEEFKNIQFIATSHSPAVVINLDNKIGSVFEITKDGAVLKPYFYGREFISAYYELFGLEKRPKIITKEIEKMFDFIDDENLMEAKKLYDKLLSHLGDTDPDLIKAKVYFDIANIENL